jgi:hypothetical protein
MSLAIIHPVISPEAFWLIKAIMIALSFFARQLQRKVPLGCSDLPGRSALAELQLKWRPELTSVMRACALTNMPSPLITSHPSGRKHHTISTRLFELRATYSCAILASAIHYDSNWSNLFTIKYAEEPSALIIAG